MTTLCFPKILKKTCTEYGAKAKSPYYDAQKILVIYDFLLKSHYYDAQEYGKKHVLYRRDEGKITIL